MDKNNIIELIDKVFCLFGFKRSGKYWKFKIDSITKMLNLTKSRYGDTYYIEASITLNNLALGRLNSHVTIYSKAKRMFQLDQEDVSDETILSEVNESLNILIYIFNKINNEGELLKYIKEEANLNGIPLIMKNYFKLPL